MSVELKYKEEAKTATETSSRIAAAPDDTSVYVFPIERRARPAPRFLKPKKGGAYASVRSLNEMVERLETHTDEVEVDAMLDEMSRPDRPRIVSFLNAHAVNMASVKTAFRQALMTSDYLLRDGMGVKLMMRIFWKDPGLNLNGTDLIPQILDRYIADGKTIALMGTKTPWLEDAARVLEKKGANIVHLIDGYCPSSSYVEALRDKPADLVILGMGMPKQEQVAVSLRDALDTPCLIVNGGAIIDFIADRFERAPLVMRKLGMEWLYRLLKEPRRLFTRYVVGNAVFLGRALWYGLWVRL